MKRILLSLVFGMFAVCTIQAQNAKAYGYLSYDSLLHAMPEYVQVQHQMQQLRQKYEAEANYNEQKFRRLYADFLQGQQEFPQNILLKRQRDLQDEMEKGLAFRHEADSLLRVAECQFLRPIREKLRVAIEAVGIERGYHYILNTDSNVYPFKHPAVSEDATPYVRAKLGLTH